MPKTSAERSRIFRKKLKEDFEKYNVYKYKDQERKKLVRSKPNTQSSAEAARKRELNRERVKRFRLKSKEAEKMKKADVEEKPVYNTPQALGKAVGKVKPHLPRSPRKRKAVIAKLASATGIHTPKKKKASTASRKSLPAATVSKVTSFYLQDSISRQAPGKKDFVTSWQSGKKLHFQKRHLMCSLKEAHALFMKENPDVKIGLSKFSSLRPVNVLFSSDMPQNVCLCQYHENIRLICDCLSKEITDFPNYSGDFVNNFVCDPDSEMCMFGNCSSCPKWLDAIAEQCDVSLDDTTLWYQWERVEVQVPVGKKALHKKKVVKKMKKVCKEGTIRDVLALLQSDMPSFLRHVFTKRQQSKYFEQRLEKLGKEEAVVQVDFAENYLCKHQDEIQAAHWNQEQVTLFTVAIWTRDSSGDRVCESHVIVSDEMSHDKTSVSVMMSIVLDKFVKEKHAEVKKVFVFSDGPSSQFKNKYIVSFLHKLDKIVHIQWNYFATSHGKGVVDGIGGTVKRLAWNAVAARKVAVVVDAKSFHEVVRKLNSSVTVSLVEKQEISEMSATLGLKKCFNEAAPIPGISRFHCIEPQENGFVECRLYSNQALVESEVTVLPFDSDDSDTESYESNEEVVMSAESCDDDGDDDVSYESNEEVLISAESCDDDGDDDDGEGDDADDDDGDNDDGDNDDGDDDDGDDDDADVDDDDNVNNSDELEDQSTNNDDNNIYPTNSIPSCQVQEGIPDELLHLFQQSASFSLPHYVASQVNAIIDGLISFRGDGLIDMNDIKSLAGKSSNPQENWLCNFVIDNYLTLIKSCARSDKNVKVITLPWENFEKGEPSVLAKSLLQKSLFEQDLLLIPCNPVNSKHWFLLALLPQKKLSIVLDSRAGDFVKPTVQKALMKMATILKEMDATSNLDEWVFSCNKKEDIPQQLNKQACGVYTCLYARCLAGLGPMVEEACFLEFRKSIIFSEHRGCLQAIPMPAVRMEEYYAVDYMNKYYLGRAISMTNQLVKFKFLHIVGAKRFNWPKRDDFDEVHLSCIFFGPVTLENVGPFSVPQQQEIEKLFNATR